MIEKLGQIIGRSPITLILLSGVHAAAGRIDEAGSVLAELQNLAQSTYVPPTFLASAHANVGETDKALDHLEEAVAASDYFVLRVHVEPHYDQFRPHPRFAALVRKMNLEP